MRVQIGTRSASAASSAHIPVPGASRKVRKASQSVENIPGPASSITQPRGRQLAKKPRGTAVSIASSERENVPITIRGGSVASSKPKSSRSSSKVPQATPAAQATTSRSRSRSTPYVATGAAASSSSAAAPADRPDVPTKLSKQPIPTRITNPQVLVELKRAKANGVLNGEDLVNYQKIIDDQEYLANSNLKNWSRSTYKDLKDIYRRSVYNKKPKEAS
jgi:activator of HSP90 ATPase